MSTATMRAELTREDLRTLNAWIFSAITQEVRYEGGGVSYHARYPLTNEQYWESYQQWKRGGNGWGIAQQGGTGIMAMLCWYHHVYKPGSREWRPSIIIRAALEEARRALASPTDTGREP